MERQARPSSMYAKITYKPGGRASRPTTRRLTLPVAIGSSPLADVIIASSKVRPLAAVLGVQNGRLTVYDMATGTTSGVDSLQRFHLNVVGPLHWRGAEEKPKGAFLSEALAVEQRWFERLPARYRRFAGEKLSQGMRLLVWTAAVLLLGMAANFALQPENAAFQDLSQVPLAMEAGKVMNQIHGASPSRFGYEKGVTFQVSGIQEHQAQALRFEVGGLDEDRELVIVVNGKETFATQAEPGCIESFCERSFAIGPDVFKGGAGEIRFVHEGKGTYLIRRIHLSTLPDITPAESLSVERWFKAAERAYRDRDITLDNILAAHDLLEKARHLLAERRGGDGLRQKVTVLRDMVSGEFASLVDELWFHARKSIKLGRYEDAKKSLNQLLVLHDDPTESEHQKIKSLLKDVEELSR